MTLPSRLKALERAVQKAGIFERCQACGFPAQIEPPLLVLNYGDPGPGVCEECGWPLGVDGQTAVAMGPNGPIRPGRIILQDTP